MAFFGVFALIVFLGLRGKEPTRQTYLVVTVAAVVASAWELFQP